MHQTLAFRIILRNFVAAGFALCMVSAVWAQPPAAPARTHAMSAGPSESGRCDIGVIPIAGNLFWIDKLGPFRFNDTHVHTPADGWGLDDIVVARVRAAARGAIVQRIAFSREDLARARRPPSVFGKADSVTDFARQVAAGTKCALYVVVHRTDGKQVSGIGAVNFVSLTDSRAFIFVLMHVRVYDGRSFELIREASAQIKDESLLERAYVNPVGGPYKVLDERSFPASREEVAANQVLREGVRSLLTESLDKTLPDLLGPSAGATSR
jgi:hypothetical protein